MHVSTQGQGAIHDTPHTKAGKVIDDDRMQIAYAILRKQPELNGKQHIRDDKDEY